MNRPQLTPAQLSWSRLMLDELQHCIDLQFDISRSLTVLRLGAIDEQLNIDEAMRPAMLAVHAAFFSLMEARYDLQTLLDRAARPSAPEFHTPPEAGQVPPPLNERTSPGVHLDDKAAVGALRAGA